MLSDSIEFFANSTGIGVGKLSCFFTNQLVALLCKRVWVSEKIDRSQSVLMLKMIKMKLRCKGEACRSVASRWIGQHCLLMCGWMRRLAMQTICSRCEKSLSAKERKDEKFLCGRCETTWISEFREGLAKYKKKSIAMNTAFVKSQGLFFS